MSDEKLASPPADEWRIMFRPLGSNTLVSWVQESFYMRELTAATARAEKAEADRDKLLSAASMGEKGMLARIEALQSELAEKNRKTISESELNELREGWIKVPAIERDLADSRRQVEALCVLIAKVDDCPHFGPCTHDDDCVACWREWSAEEARKQGETK